ncbi:MAG: iron dicitrate transport regulator FecR [Cyanothece sp. SIO1E1]|nr:iron dicitrate transport regulator FecR [Cyanothece sp. SIO1E1]
MTTSLLSLMPGAIADPLSVRGDRWLEVRRLAGNVVYKRGQTSRPAQIGLRLDAVGDSISTGKSSTTTLAIEDTGIGFVQVAERTTVQVQTLQITPGRGRVTKLSVPRGQARLQVRPFNNPESRLEILTPAGVSGVRGTDFGVSVQPDGKTGVATLEGEVTAAAQGESVAVTAGLQSLVIPGEPPSPPVPLRDDPGLDLRRLEAKRRQTARLSGQIDPVNLLLIAEEPQVIDRDGMFDIRTPLPPNRRIQVTVITPLGTRQAYELVVP